MFEMKVECPRCGRVWILQQGTPDIVCNCHLFCTQGNKPSDCSVTPYTSNLQYGWPAGLHIDAKDEGDDVAHITYYCSTHDEYYYKVPILIEANWERWFSRRAPKELRMSHGEY